MKTKFVSRMPPSNKSFSTMEVSLYLFLVPKTTKTGLVTVASSEQNQKAFLVGNRL